MSCSPGATSTSNVSSSDSTSDRVRKRLSNLRKHHMESEALYGHAQPARDATIKEETHLLLKSNQTANGTKANRSQKSRAPKSRTTAPTMSMTPPSGTLGPQGQIGIMSTPQQPPTQQQNIMPRHMQPHHQQHQHQQQQHQHQQQSLPPQQQQHLNHHLQQPPHHLNHLQQQQHQQMPPHTINHDPRHSRPSQIPQMVSNNHQPRSMYAPQTTGMSMIQPHRGPTMPNQRHPQQMQHHPQQMHHASPMHYQPRPPHNIMAMNHTTPILPNDLDLNMLHGGLECDVESIIKHEISVEGQLDFNFDLLHQLDNYTTTNISNHHYRL